MNEHVHTLECASSSFCEVCETTKLACEFYKGRLKICKSCYLERNNEARRTRLENPDEREKYNAYMRARTASMDDQQRLERQLKVYDLTTDDLDRMLKEQDGKCKICLEPFVAADTQNGGRLHIDHKHGTKIVRGLLCPNCNIMLGHAKDRVDVLMRAAQYLYESGE